MDFDTFPKAIKTLLNSKSFFKRFSDIKSSVNRKIYGEILHRAEVELYQKDQTVFLRDRVAVVTMGSIEIRRHNDNSLLKPFIVKKAIEGDILGFAAGDGNISGSPLTWLVSM